MESFIFGVEMGMRTRFIIASEQWEFADRNYLELITIARNSDDLILFVSRVCGNKM